MHMTVSINCKAIKIRLSNHYSTLTKKDHPRVAHAHICKYKMTIRFSNEAKNLNYAI
jgi:hypothetical protein